MDKGKQPAATGSTAARRRSYAQAFEEEDEPAVDNNPKGKQRELEDGVVENGAAVASEVKDESESGLDDEEDESQHCAICLSLIDNQTTVQPCMHDAYCFVCILAWTEQSRRCPLCVRDIELLIHSVRSERDYQRYYLPPLPTQSNSPPLGTSASNSSRSHTQSLQAGARRQLLDRPTHPRFKYADWRARNEPAANMLEDDAEELALMKRRYVYRHGLYVKHVASNRFTKYRDHSAQQISSSAELRQRLTRWLRRELRIFPGVDLEFLTGYVVSIASQLEMRSDSATRLLSEFLGEKDAEHFLQGASIRPAIHSEAYSFLRSPYKDVRNYDRNVQYDRPDRKIQPLLPSSPSQNRITTNHPGTTSRNRRRSSSPSSRSDYSSNESDFDATAIIRDDRPRRQSSSRHQPERRHSVVSIVDARPRRRSEVMERPPPARRKKGMDSYVPEYAPRKRQGRRGARSTKSRDGIPDKGTRQGSRAFSPVDSSRDNSRKELGTTNEGAAKSPKQDPPAETQIILQPDSDIESVISLGDDMGESARPIIPHSTSAPLKMQISIFGRGKTQASTPSNASASSAKQGDESMAVSEREDMLRQRLASSIRGLGPSSSHVTKEDSLIYRLSTTAESKRAIAAQAKNNTTKQDDVRVRLSHAKASLPIPTGPKADRALHRGTVDADLKSMLMARLQEEKRIVGSTDTKKDEKNDMMVHEREDELKKNVLAVLLARRRGGTPISVNGQGQIGVDKAESAPPATAPSNLATQSLLNDNANNESANKMQELRARIARERSLASSAPPSTSDSTTTVVNPPPANAPGISRTELLKARMEKEKKLASLRSKLMKEKEVLSEA